MAPRKDPVKVRVYIKRGENDITGGFTIHELLARVAISRGTSAGDAEPQPQTSVVRHSGVFSTSRGSSWINAQA